MTKTFRVILGVDLKKVQVYEQAEQFIITGIGSQFLGLLNLETDWPMREIRCQEHLLTSPRTGELVAHLDRPGGIPTPSLNSLRRKTKISNKG